MLYQSINKVRYLLNPVGSAGDVYPYLAVALELQQRGHSVVLVTNGSFRSVAKELSIPFIEAGQLVDWKAVGQDKKLRKPSSAWKESIGWAAINPMRETYRVLSDLIESSHQDNFRTSIVSPVWSFAARIAALKWKVPHANLIINPMLLRSCIQPPKIPMMYFPSWMPHWCRKIEYYFADKFVIDPILAPPLNEFLSELELPKASRIMHDWWFAQDLQLGLFYPSFVPTQSDWPRDVVHVGHTTWDPPGDVVATKAAIDFARNGSKPWLFVPGSIGAGSSTYFEVAKGVCEALGMRAIFLDRHQQFGSSESSPTHRQFSYVPLGELVGLCQGVVHCGGAGTLHHALKSGVPHIVWPRVNDQHDNAERIVRLGLGVRIGGKSLSQEELSHAMRSIISDQGFVTRCREFADQTRAFNSTELICDELENLVTAVCRA